MKAPVKDRKTVPWMTSMEIPAVKLVLSEWRRLRRECRTDDRSFIGSHHLERFVKDAAELMRDIAIAERKLKDETDK